MKKCLILGVFLGGSACAAPDQVDGLYVGVGVGVSSQSTTLDVAEGCKFDGTVTPPCYIERDYCDPVVPGGVGSSRSTRFAGSLEIGYGKVLCSGLYFGAVASVDLTGNKTSGELVRANNDTCPYISARVCNDGVIPFVGLRAGYHCPEIGGMLTVRVGGAYVGSKAYFTSILSERTYVAKLKNFTPAVGIELEKSMGNGFAVKLQADYRFGTKRVIRSFGEFNNNGGNQGSEVLGPKLKTSGCAIRVMGVYRII